MIGGVNPFGKICLKNFVNVRNIKIWSCKPERNSGQFADYLRAKHPQFQYLQLNKVQGQPFMVHEIVDAVKAL